MVVGSQVMNNMNRKSALMILMTVAGFAICWLPQIIYRILSISDPTLIPDLAMRAKVEAIAGYIALLNSGLNPIIYVFRMKEFRSAISKVFCSVFGIHG